MRRTRQQHQYQQPSVHVPFQILPSHPSTISLTTSDLFGYQLWPSRHARFVRRCHGRRATVGIRADAPTISAERRAAAIVGIVEAELRRVRALDVGDATAKGPVQLDAQTGAVGRDVAAGLGGVVDARGAVGAGGEATTAADGGGGRWDGGSCGWAGFGAILEGGEG